FFCPIAFRIYLRSTQASSECELFAAEADKARDLPEAGIVHLCSISNVRRHRADLHYSFATTLSLVAVTILFCLHKLLWLLHR
ncbi:MAG TPA: hypothetical protein PK188_06670, partial [Thermosynergistes sp.]|nr:hypothetical protein [Thermosynergistes sp.]